MKGTAINETIVMVIWKLIALTPCSSTNGDTSFFSNHTTKGAIILIKGINKTINNAER